MHMKLYYQVMENGNASCLPSTGAGSEQVKEFTGLCVEFQTTYIASVGCVAFQKRLSGFWKHTAQ